MMGSSIGIKWAKTPKKKRNLKPRKCKKPNKSKINEENSLTVRRSDIWSSIRIKLAKHQNKPEKAFEGVKYSIKRW